MSNYRILISSRAQRDFKKLSADVRAKVTASILSLETTPRPPQFKSLIGRRIAQFRLRIGDYRVLYDVYEEDKVVFVLRIGHRREIYR